ncbi:MAG: hemerythrin domain-containing protein, partial [Planctomycetota bacterium]
HVKQALRVTLDWNAPAVGLPRKLSSLQFVIKSFCRHLHRVMELEEQDGYMVVVAEQKPNLDIRIKKLEREHAFFRREMERIAPAVASLSEFDVAQVERVCEEIYRFLDHVDRHDADEVALLQDSMLCDEGGEG